MTVKDVFELRRQGRIEEAYDAIRPMYAVHKGRYTTLCMFWTASDIFKKRLEEGRLEEAEKIFESLKRVFAYISDREGAPGGDTVPVALGEGRRSTVETASGFMQYAARRLAEAKAKKGEEKQPLSPPAPSASPQEGEELSGRLAVGLDEGVLRPIESINALQRVVLACIVGHPGYTLAEVSESTGIPSAVVERHIAVLVEHHLVEYRGVGDAGGYWVNSL